MKEKNGRKKEWEKIPRVYRNKWMIQYHLVLADWRKLRFFLFTLSNSHRREEGRAFVLCFNFISLSTISTAIMSTKLRVLRISFFLLRRKSPHPSNNQQTKKTQQKPLLMLKFWLFVWQTSHETTHDLSYKVYNEKNPR